MVTRKPVAASQVPAPLSQAANNPPYPTSPVAGQDPDPDRWETRSRSSSVSSHDTWNSGFSEDESSPRKEIPAALRVGPRNAANTTNTSHTNAINHTDDLPSTLRPGAPKGANRPVQQSQQPNPWALEEHAVSAPDYTPAQSHNQQQPPSPAAAPAPVPAAPPIQSHNSHNPYLRMQATGQSTYGNDSQAAWGDVAPAPPPPLTMPPPPPVELPTVRTPTEAMAGMTLDSQLASKRSTILPPGLQPALIPQKTGPPAPLEQQHTGASSNPWDEMDKEEENKKDQAYQAPSAPSEPPADKARPYLPQPAHSPPQPYKAPQQPPVPVFQPAQPSPAQQVEQPWQTTPQYQPPKAAPPLRAEQAWQASQDYQPQHTPPPFQSQPANQHQRPTTPLISFTDTDDEAPHVPQTSSAETPPRQPSRPDSSNVSTPSARPNPINISTSSPRPSSSDVPETPMTRARRQRNETYQIKQVNWFDASAGPSGKMRRTPIMTQNANGPCPLLALVNALTLSTPDHIQTALVDALVSREQVSLGLLLDAVFEELARRSEISDKELPDVGDLYSFLITLHTGMNVNPRFVASGTSHVGSVEAEVPIDHTRAKAGVFEETREMVLYSTFDIPLIHGWTPPSDSPEYAAFNRSAKTFDDALNIQFREQELEDKLQSVGLSPTEQQTYEDIALIKHYLDTFPTQLTDHGLEVISRSLKAGQIAILFRNDHFSTLYKHPQYGTLMTLVTDAGYSSHEEIVWESLVDVSGAANELFSGDFRPVGNTNSSGLQAVQTSHSQVPTANMSAERQYAPPPGPPPGRSSRSPSNLNTASDNQVQRSASEQEDHDLALALQLQEEEEEASRADATARRAREDELSRQFLDRENATRTPTSPTDNPGSRPPIPPRRSNLGGAASPGVDAPYVRGSEGADDLPPTYEQAASDRPFRPAGSSARRSSNRQGDALGALNAIQAQQRNGGHPNASSMSVNSFATTATQASGHPGMQYRRRSSIIAGQAGNASTRMRRSQSQTVPGSQPNQGVYGGANYPGNMANTAPGNRVQEPGQEKCVVM